MNDDKQQPTFGLVMCVRNESHIIGRCLASVRALVDRYLICDTGSTDDTPTVVAQAMQGIPGQVVHHDWQNYGYNKSWLLREAFCGALSSCTYLFWLDADEVYFDDETRRYPTDRTKLVEELKLYPDANIFHLTTLYGNNTYTRWNLVRNNQLYEWWLPAHEILQPVDSSAPSGVQPLLKSIVLLARADGARSIDKNHNKAEEYCQLFEQFFKSKENVERDRTRGGGRGLFYFAQSLQEAGRYTEAVAVYAKRFEITNGSIDERYWSALRSSRMLEAKLVDGFENSDDLRNQRLLFLAWQATQVRPHRLEAREHWLRMRNHLKRTDENRRESLQIAKDSMKMLDDQLVLGREKLQQQRSYMFAEWDVYDYKLAGACALAAHYAGDNQSAVAWCQRALQCTTMPDERRKLEEQNCNVYRSAAQSTIDHVPMQPESSILQKITMLYTSIPKWKCEKNPPSIMVIDDVLHDPHSYREFALSQPFNVHGNYPGVRTISFARDEWRTFFEQRLGVKISWWPTDDYNGAFQLCTKNTSKSWIHRDSTDYAAVLYLTPSAPLSGGTSMYQHKFTKLEKSDDERQKRLLDRDSQALDEWNTVDRVGNKFNRLVIFDGRRSHMSDDYFGDSHQTGRLFQVFFFNIEK